MRAQLLWRRHRLASSSHDQAASVSLHAHAEAMLPTAKEETEERQLDPEAQAESVPLSDPAAIAEPLDCLLDELQLCTRYYSRVFPETKIEKVIFLGGESRHLPICQKVARALRLGAQLGDPLARLVKVSQAQPATGCDVTQPQPGWAVPMGLCLSEANL